MAVAISGTTLKIGFPARRFDLCRQFDFRRHAPEAVQIVIAADLIVEDMHQRGLLKDTLVLMMGEFGRTPKINKDVGRDHWAPAASLILTGAAVVTGQVIGATDKEGAQVTESPVSPADVAFTVLSSLGIDPKKQLKTPDGRPVEILDQGKMIESLYA